MQIEHKSLELMHEQRLTVFTDMYVCVQRDGGGSRASSAVRFIV